jgi:hypothetical protein
LREWPADHVERRPVDGLVPSARNARLHTEAHVRQIAARQRREQQTSEDNVLLGDGYRRSIEHAPLTRFWA